MKHVFITTAAAALLLASQGAIAQPRERGEGPGQNMGQGQGPGVQAPGPGPSRGEGPGRSGEAPGRAGPPAHAPGPIDNPGMHRGNSGNAPGHNPASNPRVEHQQPQRPVQQHAQPQAPHKADQPRMGEGKQQPTTPRADVKGKDADTNRTARDATPGKDGVRKDADRGRDTDRNRNDTARTKDNDRDRNDTARTKDNDRDRNDTARNRDNDKGHGDRMAGNQDLRQARERLDTQERTRLHQAFDRQGARANVRVNVNVGSRVPRNIRLVRVPQTVISFFPYYRDYSYFVEDETVYIVNPRTYQVVDVIDEGYGRGHPVQQARLNLSERQISIVQEVIASADIPPEHLRLRLALGAEIPRDVELHRFPGRLIDEVRELENYRFVIVEDQIVIVSPMDRSIAMVIDRT